MSKNKIFHFGNVGINQNNPTFMLDVNGETRINNNLVIGSGDKIYTKNSQGQLTIMGGATYPGSAIKFAGGQSGATDQGQMIFYAGTSTSLQEKLRIKSNGYVGINEDEPQARLDVKASGALGSIFRRDYQGASNTTTSSSKLALTIWGQDHDDSAYGSGTEMYGPMIGFGGRIDNAVPNTGDIRAGISYKYNGHLTFHTRAGSPGIADGSNERLRIDSNGRLIVGGGSSPSQVGDGQLIVYSSDRLHPSIKCAGTSSNNANGYSLLGDNYQSDESQLNLGVSYSGSGVVLSRSVKVSGSADDTYLSSQDSYATRPSAFKLDDDGSFVFLNTSTNANTAVDSAVNLAERLRIDSTGHVLVKGSNHEVRWYRDDGTRYGAITYDGGQFNIKNPYNDHTRITKSDGTELVKFHNNGKVGINSTTPQQLLDVRGSINGGTENNPFQRFHDGGGNQREAKHYFRITKNTAQGNTTVYDLVTIDVNQNFHQAICKVFYGSRLQAINDATTNVSEIHFGINRFNGGSINFTRHVINQQSNPASHGDINLIQTVSGTQYRVRATFSSTCNSSSFMGGYVELIGVGPGSDGQFYSFNFEHGLTK